MKLKILLCVLKICRKRSNSAEKQKAEEDESNIDLHPLANVTKIDPEGIPKVPENKFLDRIRNEKDKENEPKNEEAEKPVIKRKPRIRGYTRSGRVIKGRGALVRIHFYKICVFNFGGFKLRYSCFSGIALPLEADLAVGHLSIGVKKRDESLSTVNMK